MITKPARTKSFRCELSPTFIQQHQPHFQQRVRPLAVQKLRVDTLHILYSKEALLYAPPLNG